jgi:hypothetical protein
MRNKCKPDSRNDKKDRRRNVHAAGDDRHNDHNGKQQHEGVDASCHFTGPNLPRSSFVLATPPLDRIELV